MSQQGPIIIVSNREGHGLAGTITQVKAFPLVDVGWTDAMDGVARLRPAAVVVTDLDGHEDMLTDLAERAARVEPYMPLIALDPGTVLPRNVLPFTQIGRSPERLVSRLNAALRVRALHATLLRRLSNDRRTSTRMPTNDPIDDATVLLLGRGGAYPALSVALGEQMGVVGALSIEAAAKHLNARELDGIIVGDGFTPRVLDAFLTVLSEDSRFRNLPVVVRSLSGLAADYDLPNLEVADTDPPLLAAHAVPLIRQQAFESRIGRALKSIDVGGLLDPRTGLLNEDAFSRDFATAVTDTQTRGAGLSVARITFAQGSISERMRLDAARILSRLMRRMDFATLDEYGAIVIVFAEADLRNAHAIARRLTSVLKHTMYGTKRDQRLDPQVSVATLMPGDSASSVLARLQAEAQRAAS
ncbi:MAG TPA: GGDEF domain-containing protein [Afipia sp.]